MAVEHGLPRGRSRKRLDGSGRRIDVKRLGFTLVELLVVIGIISVLISILMPALRKAREAAYTVSCASNERQLMFGFLLFANEHKGHLPGNWFDFTQTDTDKRGWLFNVGQSINEAPEAGTLFRYLNGNRAIYLCPSSQSDGVGDGITSNGRFDYVSFGVFTGALLKNIRPEAQFTDPTSRIAGMQRYATPIIVEETPDFVNGANMESLHNSGDRMGNFHRGGSNYACIDGSVQWFKQVPAANAGNWQSVGPSGRIVNMGTGGTTWGFWDKQ